MYILITCSNNSNYHYYYIFSLKPKGKKRINIHNILKIYIYTQYNRIIYTHMYAPSIHLCTMSGMVIIL